MASAFSVAGTGPTPITSGSTPAKAYETSRIATGSPSSLATSSAATRQAVAPSFSPAALPAVTRPCGRNGVRRSASASMRGARPGRLVDGGQAPAELGAAGGDGDQRLLDDAVGVRLADPLLAEHGERVGALAGDARGSGRAGSRRCSPSPARDGSTSFSATIRGLGSMPSPIGWRPMCSTPPAMATSYAPKAMPDATVVTAVIAPAHIRSIAKPGTDRGSPASSAAVRPMVRPWSPIWVVAAMATSSTRSGGSSGWRRSSSRMQLTTRSSARVSAYSEPALPKGVRTPSTKTTSRSSRGMPDITRE